MAGDSLNISGISAYYHYSVACLVRDRKITYAAQEERLSRKKHDASVVSIKVENLYREVADGDR